MGILAGFPVIRLLSVAGIILLLSLVARWALFRFIPPLLINRNPIWEEILEKRKVLRYLALAVPGTLVAISTQFMPAQYPGLNTLAYKSAVIYTILMLMMAVIAMINAYSDYYNQHFEFAKEVPIKTVVQTSIILTVLLSILTILTILLNVPFLALAGVVAAIAGIAYYLFREPLLGFSASLQLSMNHMLGLGDWIDMPAFGADGEVEEINVTSTKIRNWDNAIVNVPTSALIQNPFSNWHMMQSKEARRVLRAIYLDQLAITFAGKEQAAALIAKIAQLYENLPPEARSNSGMLGVAPAELRQRGRLTNLELFMAYATMVIAGQPQTRADYDVYVRQQPPTPQGLPVEAYFFTRATGFVPYNAVQREIFSHLLAVLPEFGLRPFQLLEKTL